MFDSAREAFVHFLWNMNINPARVGPVKKIKTKNVMGDRRSIGFEVQRWDRPEFNNNLYAYITDSPPRAAGRHHRVDFFD